ncbi:flagellar hook-basal body complex protein FliE [bacterium]|nr:flagellar hook-basal body complex protein FliE [bacterium]MBU1024738.1 flagellar hook-basal body complex protein FliE [bacterium]
MLVGKAQTQPLRQAGGDGSSFGDFLTEALEKINALGEESQSKQIAFAAGENIELHEVVIAMEKYSIAMDLMLAVRNKILEAYQEISRMPV